MLFLSSAQDLRPNTHTHISLLNVCLFCFPQGVSKTCGVEADAGIYAGCSAASTGESAAGIDVGGAKVYCCDTDDCNSATGLSASKMSLGLVIAAIFAVLK